MRLYKWGAAAFVGATVIALCAPVGRAVEQAIPVACRHDRPNAVDKARRAQAVVLAKAINTAQMDSLRRARKYEPAANLKGIPAAPDGFKLDLYVNDSGYIFSLKDSLDPCSFAVFSDHGGLLYQQSGRSAPVIAQE